MSAVTLRTGRGEIASPRLDDVASAVERATQGRGDFVTLERGDSFVQASGDELEWGRGEDLRRARWAAGVESSKVIRERLVRFWKDDPAWSEGLAWEPVAVPSAAAQRPQVGLWLAAAGAGAAAIAWRLADAMGRLDESVRDAAVSSVTGAWVRILLATGLGTALLLGVRLLARPSRRAPVLRPSAIAVLASFVLVSSAFTAVLVGVASRGDDRSGMAFLGAGTCSLAGALVLRQGHARPWSHSFLEAAGLTLLIGGVFAL